jgi:hypothetical protein
MYRFRLFIILLITWLFFVLNVERPDNLLGLGNVNIASYVYVIAALMPVSFLMFLKLSKASIATSYMPFLGLYAVGKMIYLDPAAGIEKLTFISLFEVALLLVTLIGVRSLTRSIYFFGDSIKNSAMNPNNTLVQTTHHGEMTIRQKIAQARRFNRSLTLLYVPLGKSQRKYEYGRLWDQQEDIKFMYLQFRIAELIKFLLWETDVRAWHQGDLILCLQGNDELRAHKLVEQIPEVLRSVLKIETSVSMVRFPQEGIVYNDLLAKLRNEKAVENRAVVFDLEAQLKKQQALETLAARPSQNRASSA